jgi:hypothetical protein
MCSAAVSWESTMLVAIQNYFAKRGSGTLSEVSTEDYENNEGVKFQGHTNFLCNFDEFLNVDKSIPTNSVQKTSLDGWPYL